MFLKLSYEWCEEGYIRFNKLQYMKTTKHTAKESDDVFPDLIYATTKKQCELLCESFGSVYDLPIVVLRFFNVYVTSSRFQKKTSTTNRIFDENIFTE